MTSFPLTAMQVTSIQVFVALLALGVLVDLCTALLLPDNDQNRR